MRYDQMLAEMVRTPWAMLPEKIAPLYALVASAARGDEDAKAQLEAKITNREAKEISRRGGRVVVVPITGVITHRDWWGSSVSTRRIAETLRKHGEERDTKAIILEIDSPGGTVAGVEELATEMHALRESGMPVVAVANSMAASAAYWLASQASDVAVTPTGQVGSIGVYAAHVDYSEAFAKAGIKVSFIHAGKYKVEGNPFAPLDEEAREEIQASVDGYYGMFVDAVRRGRGSVSEDVMQGRMYPADAAVTHGLADRVATLDETIDRYLGQASISQGRLAAYELEIEALDLA